MKIYDVIEEILKAAPIALKLDYDNSGLQVGDTNKPLKNILVTLDVNIESVMKAVKKGVNLIVSHHPLIFKALRKINTQDETGRKIVAAIKNDICIYSSHTNFDSAYGGLNDHLAGLLGIVDTVPLTKSEDAGICKIVVFVPIGYDDKVRNALYSIGAGAVGDYTGCSFSVEGEGTFCAPDSSTPFIGEKGRVNTAQEKRVEMVIPQRLINKAVIEILRVHPYEEPAFDVYPLIDTEIKSGLGRIGTLKSKVTLSDLAELVKRKLSLEGLRLIGRADKKVKKVAVCSGSGGSLIRDAINRGADAFVTGDIKYHEAIQAKEAGLSIIDAGHYATEIVFVDYVKKLLTKFLKDEGSTANVFTYKTADPFCMI